VSLLPFQDQQPRLAEGVFVAPGAWIIGNVTIGPESGVWYNAVLRGDTAPITIGRRTNLQDGMIVHVDDEWPTVIGDEVTIGHAAIIHGATIAPRVLIGMRSVILSGAVIGEGSIIGAGALVAEKKEIPPRSLVIGTPGRVVREVTDAEFAAIARSATHYWELAQAHRASQQA
jgi:gamma-carbonic anhydrase